MRRKSSSLAIRTVLYTETCDVSEEDVVKPILSICKQKQSSLQNVVIKCIRLVIVTMKIMMH